MKLFVNLFVVAVVSCVVLKASAQCTPATCPSGPVIVNFEYLNCTGERTYYSAQDQLNPCLEVEPGYSSLSFADDTGLWTYTKINNPTCDLTIPGTTFYERSAFIFGVCWPGSVKRYFDGRSLLNRDPHAALGLSSMYLSSVNASFDSPQDQTPDNPEDLPIFAAGLFPCYGPNNCTLPDGSAPTLHISSLEQHGNCSSAEASAMFDAVVGACYYDGYVAYVALQCAGPNGFDTVSYADDKCSKPFYLQGSNSNCEDPDVFGMIYCTAPVSPVIPPPPSNSASILSIGPVAIIAILLALVL